MYSRYINWHINWYIKVYCRLIANIFKIYIDVYLKSMRGKLHVYARHTHVKLGGVLKVVYETVY